MKNMYIIFLLPLASAQCAAGPGRFYLGASGGDTHYSRDYNNSLSGYPVEDSTGFSIYGGINVFRGFAIEGEYSNLDSKTEQFYVCSSTFSCQVQRYDVSADTYSLFAAYRSRGDVYFKARLGYVYENMSINTPSPGDHSKNGYGFAFGLGSGVRLGAIDFEVQQTVYRMDIGYTSLGMHFKF